MLRLGVFLALVCGVALAVGVAGAATPNRAVFAVTLSATLTKDWTVKQTEEGECGNVTRYVGHWRLDLSSRRPSRVVATAPARPGGAVRFSGALVRSLAGTARETGSTATGPPRPACGGSPTQRDCTREQRGLRNARAAFASPRRGVLRFGRLQRASAIRSLNRRCGNEPADVRSIRTDLSLADGPLAAADVFARDVPRFFVTGHTVQVTTLEGEFEGTVTERVRWTATFRRLAR